MKFSIFKKIECNKGLTLIEIMVVITVISILSVIAVPKITGLFSNKRENLAVFTGIVAKTFDDSFLNDRINYLVIHLFKRSEEAELDIDKEENDIFNRNNGLSVLNLKDGQFVDTRRRILKYEHFNDNFRISSVVLPSGETIEEGNVIVPFYPQGYSNNLIVHILVNDSEKISIRLYKHLKDPNVTAGYTSF